MRPFLIIDGNNLTLRALYGCQPLHDSTGQPTGCLMTSIRSILRIADRIKPAMSFVVWDAGHSKFRKTLFPEYKLRKPLDEEKQILMDEWKVQTKLLEEYLPALGIGQMRVSGCEADDIIFKMTQDFKKAQSQVIIASADADFLQLVDEKCTVLNLSDEKIIDASFIKETYGIAPSQWVEFRAMIGDNSDNINGVQGVGPKRAAEALIEFSNLDNFFKKAAQKTKLKKWETSLLESRSIIDRNKNLMDLSKLPEKEIPFQIFDDLFFKALDLDPDHEKFWKACSRHQLNLVIADRHLWSGVCFQNKNN